MRGDFDEDEIDDDDGYPFDGEDPYCHRCDNKGTIIVCIDDLCRGAGECMHGDGEIICPDCKGENADW
jgi:hypothetical protein